MKHLILVTFTFLLFGAAQTRAQTAPTPEEPTVIIKASTADKAADCFIQAKLKDDQINALNDANAAKDAAVVTLKLALAQAVQKGIDADGEIVRLTAIIEQILKMSKVKKIGILVF